jgi:hypothetical protein
LHLDRRIASLELGQPSSDPLARRFRGHALAGRPGTGEQGFDLAQPVAQLRFIGHRRPRRVRTLHPWHDGRTSMPPSRTSYKKH